MAAEIYNEGRAVGLSAYEIYVKQFLLENPDGQPASEKEWLAASVASGSSLLAYIPKDTQTYLNEEFHSVDVTLPLNTSLRAANTIIGSWAYVNPNVVVPEFAENTYYSCDGYTHIPASSSAPEFVYGKYYKGTFTLIPDFADVWGFNYTLSFIPNKYYEKVGTQYNILTNKPADWDYNYYNYYFIDYVMLRNSPSGWNTHYTDYYQMSYTLLASEPANWHTQYNQYYILDSGVYKLVPIEYKNIKYYSDILIPNTQYYHPIISDTSVEVANYPTNIPSLYFCGEWTINNRDIDIDESYTDYRQILEGVILQPGSWEKGETIRLPYLEFTPDLTKSPVLRVLIRGTLTHGVYVLLTGFTDVGVLNGTVGLESSIYTTNPQNGDFLGPAVYPWANKVIFTVSNGILDMTYRNAQSISYNHNGTTTDTGAASVALSYMTNALNIPSIVYEESPTNVLSNDVAAGSGFLNWSQLFRALSNDKKIQIVSDILQSLSSNLALNSTNNDFELNTGYGIKLGKNYISFNDGLRLYVSSSEPDPQIVGTIPNGSIGIGWSPAS